MKKTILILFSAVVLLSSCTENYSNGERVGLLTQFSKTGLIWKSYEGHLNMTQTGMNSSQAFDFSIDNDDENDSLVKQLDSAALYGWKVKLIYHQVSGKNWFGNRGGTDHFVTKCEVLDRNIMKIFGNNNVSTNTGKVIDTIYVVIVDKNKIKKD